MNDNQDKNNSFDEDFNPHVGKKIAKFSAFIYLALAITVVIVATVGIFSVSYDYEESFAPVSMPEIQFGNDFEFSTPEASQNSVFIPEFSEEAPVINEESDITPEVSQPEEIVKTFYYPVQGEIAKNFSMDALVYSETMKDYRVHSGIDITAEMGSDVVCFTDGVVESISDDYFYGRTIAVSHSDGMVSYYMNLDPLMVDGVEVGSEVKAGQRLGNLGKTAKCESADPSHLHFELRVNKILVDPTNYLPEKDNSDQ